MPVHSGAYETLQQAVICLNLVEFVDDSTFDGVRCAWCKRLSSRLEIKLRKSPDVGHFPECLRQDTLAQLSDLLCWLEEEERTAALRRTWPPR